LTVPTGSTTLVPHRVAYSLALENAEVNRAMYPVVFHLGAPQPPNP
jgi:hypothetical protein